MRIPCPPPGIYRDVPPAEYHAWDAASNSALGLMSGGRTPAHARHALDNPPPATPAKVRGDAAHALILEPALFDARYMVASSCTAPLASGARKGEPCGAAGVALTADGWRCGIAAHGAPAVDTGGRRLVSAADYDVCRRMRDAVLAHDDARALLEATTDREVSLVFDWPLQDGRVVRCKARIDLPAWDAGVLGDLKTTSDASRRGFRKSVESYGYYRQAAFYREAAAAHGHDAADFWFIAVESDAPHLVNRHDLDAYDIGLGRMECERLLCTWAEATASGNWPGYPSTATPLALTDWKRTAILEEIA